jgi:hypothetical protein
MARVSSAFTGPFSSMGSPTTFRMRPNVALPTGMVIGAPISVTACAAHQTLGCVHRDGAHGVFAQVLSHFEDQALAIVVGLKRVQDLRQVIFELHVHDGADDLGDFADCIVPCRVSGFLERFRARDNFNKLVGDHSLT